VNIARGVSANSTSAVEAADPDGRRRRSQDSRARIVAAMLELIHGGDVAPGAEQVAERAQVGLRTVFRHFKDMDSLYREISHVIEGELRRVVARPFRADTWEGRILELIERRSQVFEKIAPFKRASDAHRHHSRFLAADHGRLAAESREILRRQLPAELTHDEIRFETLDLLLSYETWSRLRREQNLTRRRAREVLEAAVRRVLEA
jgi:AcrR family transcriptional regulator